MQLLVEVSVGDVIDKITILELKTQRISDPSKLANVRVELDALNAAIDGALQPSVELDRLRAELFNINAALWQIEDDIRLCEGSGDFGPRFIELARAVYVTNDRRAAVKKQINLAVGSRLVEEKSYAGSL
ncbi:MAG: DUF6165 family protein [Devosia sp.]